MTKQSGTFYQISLLPKLIRVIGWGPLGICIYDRKYGCILTDICVQMGIMESIKFSENYSGVFPKLEVTVAFLK
jgi:hypothetical protein